ncbi:MAG: phytoene/squalene synthase family protein [Comamonadaceae bacterium]|nr:MAG: phytoene/squalene synthase family protein [Comamonadaceae bacterium]
MQTLSHPNVQHPHSAARLSPEQAADLAACRASLSEGSYTFYAASMVLPRGVRDPACALYAFCRMADDAVDGAVGGGADQHAAVHRLRRRLDRAYDAQPAAAACDRALAAVVARFQMPRALPQALIEGFEWDAQGRSYETIEELTQYAARVAGSVGAMMAVLMGARSPEALARACDLGVAMQLSNIARDVGEDARMGRLYLPLAWLRETGIDPDAWLAQPTFEPRLASVVRRLLDTADLLYARAGAGVSLLPLACRPGINAARLLYAEIGHQVARNGLDSVSQRARVPRSRKALLLVRAVLTLRPSARLRQAPCLPANRFLMDAAARPAPAQCVPWWRMDRRLAARAAWVIDLFERLERRERGAHEGA